jgi:tRNA modification GTPase
VRPADTIAAVASGWAVAPRAIVRLSGPGVAPLLRELCPDLPPPPTTPGPGTLATGRLRLTPTLAVPCLVLRSIGPRSFTGEDTAELLLPSSPPLLERVLACLCARPGVREAGPGEFSARAYLNGRLALAQAEGLAAAIAARTDAQLDSARRLLDGSAGHDARAWLDQTARLLALVEAGIDFTDQEDVVPIAPAELARRLEGLAGEVESSLGSVRGGEHAVDAPRVVLLGPPNAGKSTLFNALLGRNRAVASPVAGTTRDVLVEPLELSSVAPGSPAVLLVDLPGLDAGLAGRSELDASSQAAARGEALAADVVLSCDPSGRFADGGIAGDARVIRVRTKGDLPLAEQPSDALSVCALDGWNLPVLRRAIADAAWSRVGSAERWVLPRHRRTLGAALGALRAARAGVDASQGALGAPELVAGELRAALDHLGEIAGAVPPDEVIGRIFATFCVGK